MHKTFRLAYFAPDVMDPAVWRRIDQLRRTGAEVETFIFSRDHEKSYDVKVDARVHLIGSMPKGRYLERIPKLVWAYFRMLSHVKSIRSADIIIARNPDMLGLALLLRATARSSAKVIYEVLDIQGLMHRPDLFGRIARRLESKALSRVDLIIVSSEGFIRNYFSRLDFTGRYELVENRLYLDRFFEQDSARVVRWRSPDRSKPGFDPGNVHIGWVGGLRCKKSAEILRQVAQRYGSRVCIHIHGRANFCTEAEFRTFFAGQKNVIYHGIYRFPDDLYEIYRQLDLNWCFDFSGSGNNGRWLLPNRIYEGGYFGVPHLGERGTEIGRRIEYDGIGWTFTGDIAESIQAFIGTLDAASYRPVKEEAVRRMDQEFRYDGDIVRVLRRVGLSG